jgi:hypothetical protein
MNKNTETTKGATIGAKTSRYHAIYEVSAERKKDYNLGATRMLF